jgi:hypothetical protein
MTHASIGRVDLPPFHWLSQVRPRDTSSLAQRPQLGCYLVSFPTAFGSILEHQKISSCILWRSLDPCIGKKNDRLRKDPLVCVPVWVHMVIWQEVVYPRVALSMHVYVHANVCGGMNTQAYILQALIPCWQEEMEHLGWSYVCAHMSMYLWVHVAMRYRFQDRQELVIYW